MVRRIKQKSLAQKIVNNISDFKLFAFLGFFALVIGATFYFTTKQQDIRQRAEAPLPLGSLSPWEAGGKIWMQTPKLKVGFDLSFGGVVTDLVSNDKEIVNRADPGRNIAVALYDGNQNYDGCGGCSGKFGWNPTQGGDKYGHGATIIGKNLGSSSFYVKVRPLEWVPDDKGGGLSKEIPSPDIIMEQWAYYVSDQPNSIKIHMKLTNTGSTYHENIHQEFPAAYTNKLYNKFVYYGGANPWTNEPTIDTKLPQSIGTNYAATKYFYTPEKWGSLVDAENFGLTIFTPGQLPYITGTGGDGAGPNIGSDGPLGQAWNYFAPQIHFGLEAGATFESDYYVIVGNVTEARKSIYAIKNLIGELPSHAPAGAIDNPPPPQINPNPITVTGNMPTDGWAFMTNQITEVQLFIDDIFEGTASLNRTRPDISAIYPNVYPFTGFYHVTDTKKYPNGEHLLVIKTVAGNNTQTLLKRKFNIAGSTTISNPTIISNIGVVSPTVTQSPTPTPTPTTISADTGLLRVVTSPTTAATIVVATYPGGKIVSTTTWSVNWKPLAPGLYYIVFSYPKTAGLITPANKTFTIYKGYTTKLIGNFTTGITTVVYK